MYAIGRRSHALAQAFCVSGVFSFVWKDWFYCKKKNKNKKTWEVKSVCEMVSAVHVCLCHFCSCLQELHTHTSCFVQFHDCI